MATRAQIEQVKLYNFNSEDMKFTKKSSNNCDMTQSIIEQLRLVVIQCLFHISIASEDLQLRPEAAILKFSLS